MNMIQLIEWALCFTVFGIIVTVCCIVHFVPNDTWQRCSHTVSSERLTPKDTPPVSELVEGNLKNSNIQRESQC